LILSLSCVFVIAVWFVLWAPPVGVCVAKGVFVLWLASVADSVEITCGLVHFLFSFFLLLSFWISLPLFLSRQSANLDEFFWTISLDISKLSFNCAGAGSFLPWTCGDQPASALFFF